MLCEIHLRWGCHRGWWEYERLVRGCSLSHVLCAAASALQCCTQPAGYPGEGGAPFTSAGEKVLFGMSGAQPSIMNIDLSLSCSLVQSIRFKKRWTHQAKNRVNRFPKYKRDAVSMQYCDAATHQKPKRALKWWHIMIPSNSDQYGQ